MGTTVILPAFVVVIVGGAGSVRGALISALVFGMLHSASTTLISPTASVATGLVAMLAILTVKPEGLFSA
jgi:branched-subunit amino acid ABC-type transport system permease component